MQSLYNQIWRSRVSTSTKLKVYNTCILPIFLYGSDCWAVSRTDARKIDDVDQWCLRGIKAPICSQRRGPEANATTQTHCNSPVTSPDPFWALRVWTTSHITDTKRILSTLPPEDWRRPRGRPRTTWLSTIQQDLRSHNLTLPEAMDMAQNRSL